jgi:hypothetical protein
MHQVPMEANIVVLDDTDEDDDKPVEAITPRSQVVNTY